MPVLRLVMDISRVSLVEIRRQWDVYASLATPEQYQNIWRDWAHKQGVDLTDANLVLVRSLLENTIQNSDSHIVNGNELILTKMSDKRRHALHTLCDKLGIHHNSVTVRGTRELHLYKPTPWLWEFSAPNPYSKPPTYQDQRKADRETQRDKRLARKHCSECGVNGLEAELFSSVYIGGIYCESCLDEMSDGEGGVFSDHKFEPI